MPPTSPVQRPGFVALSPSPLPGPPQHPLHARVQARPCSGGTWSPSQAGLDLSALHPWAPAHGPASKASSYPQLLSWRHHTYSITPHSSLCTAFSTLSTSQFPEPLNLCKAVVYHCSPFGKETISLRPHFVMAHDWPGTLNPEKSPQGSCPQHYFQGGFQFAAHFAGSGPLTRCPHQHTAHLCTQRSMGSIRQLLPPRKSRSEGCMFLQSYFD